MRVYSQETVSECDITRSLLVPTGISRLNLETKEFEVSCTLNYKIKFSPYKLLIFVSHCVSPTCLPYSFLPCFISFVISFFFILLSLFFSFVFVVFLCLNVVGLHIFSKCLFHFNFLHLTGPHVDLVLTTNRFSSSANNTVEPEFQWIHSSICFRL